METTTPQRSGTAPAGADVILHIELVLHHVGVGPDGLLGVTGHERGQGLAEVRTLGILDGEEVRVIDLVVAGGP